MNRTLLLILCDFLLLNLLALTRWEQAEPAAPARPAATVPAAATAAVDQDLVETMRLSLEDERQTREQVAQRLRVSQDELDARAKALASLESERAQLSGALESTRRESEERARAAAASASEAQVTKARLAQTQRELDEKQRLAAEQERRLSELSREQAEARDRIEGLSVAVKVAEQEKLLLRETADTLKVQVVAEREERLRVQATATELAQGVGQLAEKSTELSREIRENRPVNANTLFNEFLAQRVRLNLSGDRRTFLAPITRTRETRTVLLRDGDRTYALVHIDETPLVLREPPVDWERLTTDFRVGERRYPAKELQFLTLDPRVVAVPVPAEVLAAGGVRPYETAIDPFKFPEAVLISQGGAGYGEVPFKLDPSRPGYVRMDNRLVRRLLGDFSPSRGDIVLSKTGEFLGVMVNSEYCAVVGAVEARQTLTLGVQTEERRTAPLIAELARRWRSLPLRLQ
jgi:hypothetical protein